MKLGQERFSENNQLLGQLLDEKKCLIAVHRGSWGGNIIQNTVGAYIASFRMGADMVEADVNSSTDGILYCFHDNHEKDVFGVDKLIKTMDSQEIESYHPLNAVSLPCAHRINRLTEVLSFLPERKLLNIDRAWDIFPQLLALLDQYPKALQQVVIKAPLKAKDALEVMNNHPTKYMFMPICYSMADVEEALSYKDINIVGCEIIAFSDQDELYQDASIADIHAKGLYTWVNAIQLGDYNRKPLFGPLDDDISVLQDPALGWGKLFEKKIDIIQTDWPALLYQHRKEALGVK